MSDEQTPKTLQYRFDGPEDAPVVVLGPSLGTTWHMWDRQVPELTRQWRVLRYDLPGHGGAPAHPSASTAELADRLLRTLDQAGIERFGYAGCSFGGAIGTQLALRAPHRVASLALISSAARYGTPDAWRQRGVIVRANGLDQIAQSAPERWFAPGFRTTQTAIVDWAVQMVRSTDPECYVAACEALASHDVRADLDRIAVPALVLNGSEDPVTPPADARALVAGITDARLAVVPGASHLVPVEQPAAVTELLVRHFEAPWSEPTGTYAMAPAPTSPVAPMTAPLSEGPSAVAPFAGGGPAAAMGVRPGAYDEGDRIRREVLGDAHVDRAAEQADGFGVDFEDFVTRYAWGEVWNRPGLDRRTRSVVSLTALVAGGHHDDLAAHIRAALRNGLSPAEIEEVLLQTAVHCGVPAAGAAFTVARQVIREETHPGE
ncbi:alpha/beta fold hydrolase [Streptomyces sp. NPDC002574]|uniref:bifunctional 3-oxoadipate enol-lactonase/4-carboxymuconolactone decarboxylase PcaDC n=1 Tax=Streptomyces sp. NPDC002574 TaxID=3364652 RepID=UPI0036AA3C19